ncbi:MAG: phenylacetate--CoA ligase family protein [Alphaproteobacteria bacterium]|nr:phenylacetate--CoA ligase family protein [Alphaproteobacteria bacterium]
MPMPYPDDPHAWAARREANFQRQMDLVFAYHPYYRRRFQELGLGRADFRTLADIQRIPPIDKFVYMADPEAFRLRYPDGAVTTEEETLWQVIYTSGSTARPTPFYDTTHDHFSRVLQMARAAAIAGIGESDTVINLFPLTATPHQGFLSATYGPLGVDAKLIAGYGGRLYPPLPVQRPLDEIIALAARQRATVLWGMSSYVRRLLIRAEEMGADFSAVRLAFGMGEPCPPGMRADMRRRLANLGAPGAQVLSGYGFTEMQGPSMECREGSGYHIPTPGEFLFEILDPLTQAPLPEGADGLITVSHLNRRGTVLLRYITGDVTALTSERCPHCGRREPRVAKTPYRVQGLTKVKGTLINPAAIQDALAHLADLKEFQIVVEKAAGDAFGGDVLKVRIVCDDAPAARLAAEVAQTVVKTCEVRPEVERVAADMLGSIAESYKHKRFVDTRPRLGD